VNCCTLGARRSSCEAVGSAAYTLVLLSCIVSGCSTTDPTLEALADNQPQVMGWASRPDSSYQKPKKPDHAQPFVSNASEPALNVAERSALGTVQDYSAASQQSAACHYFRNDAAATATILRSPTLAGEVTDTGNKAFAVDFDVMDLEKARLIERAAVARCHRLEAELTLDSQNIRAPHRLTRAGFQGKADAVEASENRLQSYRKKIEQALRDGNMTISQASGLKVAIAAVIADGANARSQAERRNHNGYTVRRDIGAATTDLVTATHELDQIKRRIRTAEALSLRVIGGWRDQEDSQTTPDQEVTDTNPTGYYGKVKMSVRLGAFNPRRRDLENAAALAEVEALSEEGGALWVQSLVATAHKKALSGLTNAKAQLERASAGLKRDIRTLELGDPRRYLGALLKAKIALVQTEAELAAIRDSIAEIENNQVGQY
jgi:hypothetical protein